MRNTGKGFEGIITDTAAAYEQAGRLTLRKVDPPTRVIGKGRIIFLPNPFLDYVGSWTEQGGRAVFIEAKSTAEPKLALDQDSSSVTTKQLIAMGEWCKAGAATCVLWEWKGQIAFLHPWLLRDTLRVRKHIKFEEGIRIHQGKGFVLADFLPELWRWFPPLKS